MNKRIGTTVFLKPHSCVISECPYEDISERQYNMCLNSHLTIINEDTHEPYTNVGYLESSGYRDTLWIKNGILDYNRKL